MRGSDFAELKAFVAVVERRNFARAAEHLGLSPSALSQTIRQLENRIGARLLNRTTRSVAPSASGELLYQRIAPLFRDMAIAVASPDYLARHGTPRSPAELHGHACINWRLRMDGRHYRWEFKKRGQQLEVAVDGPVVTNHADIGIAAALHGLGIAYHFERDGVGELLAEGRLVQVLADWSISRPGLFLYYPNRQHRPASLGAFIDCLLDRKPFDRPE